MTKPSLTAARLRELFNYDPETGIFTRLVSVSNNNAMVGDVVGGLDRYGYHRIGIDGRRYNSHRLAWLYVHGRWPAEGIDHINGIPSDNRFSNLREATQAQNMQNQRKALKNNQSGILGVRFQNNKWRAYICVNKKQTYLGGFPTAELAHDAYLQAKSIIHPFGTLS